VNQNDTWQKVRLGLLAVGMGTTLLVLIRAIAVPKPAVTVYQFPPAVALAGWDSISVQPLPGEKELPPGQQYQYRQADRVVTVAVRVMPGDGNISRFLRVYTPIQGGNTGLQPRYQAGVGHYGILADKGTAYLTACINPSGETSVTPQQFMQNRYAGVTTARLLPWLLGQQSLTDQRCLWTLMSTPLDQADKKGAIAPENTFKTLESVWFSWYEWWQPNFPPA